MLIGPCRLGQTQEGERKVTEMLKIWDAGNFLGTPAGLAEGGKT